MAMTRGSRAADIRDDGLARDPFGLIQKWDPVGIILTGHGLALILLGEVADAAVALILVLSLGLWRLITRLIARSGRGPTRLSMLLAGEGGSLVLAAALVAADGGTESPFFFWPLILLAWCALVLTRSQATVMVAITVVSYIGVVVVASDVTATSMARLGLLIAFAGVLIVVRSRIDYHRASAEYSENLLRDAIGVTPAGLMVLSGDDYQPIYINSAALEMRLLRGLGYYSSNGIGRLREIVDEALETGRTIGPDRLDIGTADSSDRHIRVVATPHLSEGRQMVVVAAEDVTQQVAVGEERRAFFRFAGHQLRTPLTPIIAYAEMLKRGELGQEAAARAAGEIESSARDLLRLCERMLAVADLQHGTDTETGTARVGDIVDSLDDEARGDIEVSGDPEVRLICNADLVARALTELIENSRQFGEPPIRLDWSPRGEVVDLKMWDSGPGPDIESADELVFAHWGKLDPNKMMTPGMRSRLGLVQARLLISLSDGELTFARDDDDGWWFELHLPADRDAQVAV